MKKLQSSKPSLKQLATLKRKTVSVSYSNLVEAKPFYPETLMPLLVQPSVEGLNLATWAASDREFIETHLLKHRGILFRGFQMPDTAEFEQLLETLGGKLLKYSYRSTPRTHISGNIYTSTEYPAEQFIPLHNEMAYTQNWPMKIAFYCVHPAQQGGATPIADSRRVFERIDPNIRDYFLQKKVMYVRNYGNGLDLSWQTVFQTNNPLDVEEYCRKAKIEYEWKDNNRLRTRQVCQSVAIHPKTGEMVWFNQAHLFHVSSLDSTVRDSLLAEFKEEDLPRNAYYGDGSPIESSVLDAIREAYQQEMIVFPWQKKDILLLDNMLAAHGRQPFMGSRKVLAGMAQPYRI
ncbi:MAG TPA: taurine catabolism dioxygenase TauD [Cyanobacteria bacterium UBA8553]|nr:taurine catabolism dioxygenase TauD [Cyanobacteria bacterium UBA8553]